MGRSPESTTKSAGAEAGIEPRATANNPGAGPGNGPGADPGAGPGGHTAEATTPILARGTREDMSEQAGHARVIPPDEHVAAIVHDLKSPLSIIMLEATLLEQRLGARSTSAVQSGINRIHQNAAYIDRLVSDLLDLACAEAGKLQLRLERTDLPRLLADALAHGVSTPDRGRVRLEIREILYAPADAMRIERVVTNLISNALKYGPTSPVTVRLDRRGEFACVSVLDSGPGLTAEQARGVFEQYRRESRTRDGHGLGLYLSRKIIQAHGGRIGIVSAPGKGSRVYFELPLVAGTAPPTGQAPAR